ncbi:Hypothetical protein A7982_08871 [Minicystis rosea]|nr:Hypothetical protein A7982_08871 [Minicystis rosea]
MEGARPSGAFRRTRQESSPAGVQMGPRRWPCAARHGEAGLGAPRAPRPLSLSATRVGHVFRCRSRS